MKIDNKLLAIGECMLELSGQMQLGQQVKLSFGGDVLNTALYYARLGGNTSFLTALGNDTFSSQMINSWKNENIDTSTIIRLADKVPGLYAINTDNLGERSFYYWREQAPIKELFNNISSQELSQYTKTYQYIYFSGISLSRWDEAQLNIFCDWINVFKASSPDKQIIFDLNYRPKCWKNISQTKKYLEKILPLVTMVITTFDDEQMLFDDINSQQTLDRYNNFNIPTIIIKHGANPTVIYNQGKVEEIMPQRVDIPVDTTAAGDSFNAAFLAAFNKDYNLTDCVSFAQKFAAEIIQHYGAIIAREHTDKYLKILKEL
ncbi:sugar kinase [Pseudofrancisella aestuarii]|uniref:Sugar kinase n=1 Tax=Pseudofrancisella aestuarii TaxID=2670347 RepID=A0ABV9TA52_9GAMM|nr:sugar kinase [Pseudofrancisella aestuarii]